MPNFYTIWKVISEEGQVLFEGKYGECYQYLNKKGITNAKLEPFMYRHNKTP